MDLKIGKRNTLIAVIIVSTVLIPNRSYSQVFATPGLSGAEVSPSSYSGSGDAIMAAGYQNVVDNFTGSRTIRIPLCNFVSNGFSFPISLNYRTNGVKVSDIASSVGLKWNLEAGGIITRTIRDLPDESPHGRLTMNYLYNFDIDGKIAAVTDDNNSTNAANIATLGINYVSNDHYDKEPDIFSYSVNGYSGKFTLDQDGNVKQMPYTSLKISVDISLGAFVIIDEKGVKYLFNVAEQTEVHSYGWAATTRVAQYPDYTPSTTEFYSAWYLSSVYLPITYEVGGNHYERFLSFSYEEETYRISEPATIWARSCQSTNCENLQLFVTGSPNAIVNSYKVIHGLRLVSIWDENTIVDFVNVNARQDIVGANRVDFIRISQKIPEVKEVKRFVLNYHYYEGTNDETYLTYIDDSNDYTKRLMLESIIESTDPDIEGRMSETLYSFEYDESSPMPSRFTFEQDFWGYYNGNTASSIFPTLYFYPNEVGYDRYSIYPKTGYTNTEITLSGTDRTPNANTITLGSLTKITYKTGGSTTYEYEPNDFYYDGSNRLGCGIRIKKTTVYDGIDHSRDIIKEFIYKKTSDNTKSSGLLIDMPQFGSAENTHAYSMGSVSTIGFTDPLQNWYYDDFFIRNSQPTFTSGITDGIYGGYTEITIKEQDNSKTVSRFSLPGYYKQDADDDEGINCYLDVDGYCDGLFKRYFSHYCAVSNFSISPDLSGYDFSVNSVFPFAPAVNYEWNRGLLLGIKQYDADNFLLKENKYTYRLFYPEGKTTPDYVPGIKLNETDNWKLDPTNNWSTNIMGFTYAPLNFFAKYEVMTEVTKVLDSKSEKIYDKVNTGQYSETLTTFEYDGQFHCNPTKITLEDSKGGKRIIENTYALDLLNSPSYVNSFPNTYPQKGYKALTARHINVLIKQLEIFKNAASNDEKVLSGLVNYYDGDLVDVPNGMYSTVLLKEQKILRLKSPVLKSNLSDVINSSGLLVDTRYKTENLYNLYDENTNPLEFVNRSEKQSVLWGYNKVYPIAQVINAQFNDIAYTSFETSDSKGGWNYDGDMIVDMNSPTGSRHNNLINIYIDKSGLDINKTYTVSYWGKSSYYTSLGLQGTTNIKQGLTINGWTYYEHTITGTDYLFFGTQADYFIDELRLYPKNAQMETATYEPLVGVTSRCGINNTIMYYEYDMLGRIKLIRDQYKNILKTFENKFIEPF